MTRADLAPDPVPLPADAQRIVVMGNSGSGKTTLARHLAARRDLTVLGLDAIAWGAEAVRLPLAESIAALTRFTEAHDRWVVEGCYGDLLAAALERADALVFLDPGVAVCQDHCRQRPWEPDKYEDAERQDARLEALLEWVASYPSRDDEFGRARHVALHAAFDGGRLHLGEVPDLRPDRGRA